MAERIPRSIMSLQRCASLLRQRLTVTKPPVVYLSFAAKGLPRLRVPSQTSLRYLSVDMRRRLLHTSGYLRGAVVDIYGPEFAESISEGDIKWLKHIGDYVKEDDLIAEIETDKTSVEVPAQQTGTIVEVFVPEGGKVIAKQKLCRVQLGEGVVPIAESKGAESSAEGEVEAPITPRKKKAKPVTPIAPQLVGVRPPPSAPKPAAESKACSVEQRSIEDLKAAWLAEREAPPKDTIKNAFNAFSKSLSRFFKELEADVPGGPSLTGERKETRVKINRMRQRIAQRLKDAQNTYAMLTTFNEVDMSNVVEMRDRYQKAFLDKHGIKLGLMSPFVKAAAYALQEIPIVNAVIEETEILYRHYVDLSIAVATPKGLVVPVLRNVEKMDYAAIEKSLNELGVKARDGNLAIEDMEGGTFTISNGGLFGSMFSTPIINPPQSAILGMHAIFDRPVAIDGKVEIRPMMTVALTYDHRLIDGRDAVTFLKKIKSAVQDPRIVHLHL